MNVEIWCVDLFQAANGSFRDCPEPPGLVFRPAPRAPIGELEALLDDNERQRASSVPSPELRRRFIVARGSLRLILASYLDADPGQVEILGGTGIKPRLAFPHTDLCFNLSHSKNLALVAVTRGREVGVDLEWATPRLDVERLVQRFFAVEEQGYLEQSTSRADARVEFFRLWTLREAYLKGLGLGLSVPLTGFAISGPAEVPPRLLRSDYGDPAAWSLRNFSPAKGYVGALAVQATATQPIDAVDAGNHPLGADHDDAPG